MHSNIMASHDLPLSLKEKPSTWGMESDCSVIHIGSSLITEGILSIQLFIPVKWPISNMQEETRAMKLFQQF